MTTVGTDSRSVQRLAVFARAANAIVVLIPLLVLAGWTFGIEVLKRVFPGMVEMNPMTAVNFILLGAAFAVLRAGHQESWLRFGTQAGVLFVALFGAVMECKYLTGWDARIDLLLFRGSLGANRMAPNTALDFVLISVAILLFDIETRNGRRPSEYLILISALIASLALIGYGYGISRLYGVGAYVPMALHVAINFLLLSAGLLGIRPAAGMMSSVTSAGAGGAMLRRLLFLVAAVPLALGWLILAGVRSNFYDAAFGFTVFVIVVFIFLSFLLWRNAISLEREEGKRDIAEADLRKARDELEMRVKGRTADLARVMSKVHDGIAVLGSSAQEIADSATQFALSATNTAAAVTETTTTVEQVRQTAQLSTEKAKHVSESAQTAERISQGGKHATTETIAGMQRIREQADSVAASMMRLSEQSQAIGEIIAAVEDLAQQSSLLAVNAAIEASSAGEHGKGFGVVAQAIKDLADQSKRATAQVRTILSDIQKATNAALMATEQGGKAVEAGVQQSAQASESIATLAGSIAQAAHSAAQIAASCDQQLVGMEQVAIAMRNVKDASTQNVDNARHLEFAARKLNELGGELKALVDRYQSQ